MIPYVWTTTALGILVGISILLLIRHDRLKPLYALWWMGVAIGVIFLGLFPRTVDFVASYLGIHYPPVFILVVALSLLLLKILTMDLERTRQEQTLRLLVQKISLLEAEIRTLRKAQIKDSHQDGDDDRTQKEAEEKDGRRFQDRQKALGP